MAAQASSAPPSPLFVTAARELRFLGRFCLSGLLANVVVILGGELLVMRTMGEHDQIAVSQFTPRPSIPTEMHKIGCAEYPACPRIFISPEADEMDRAHPHSPTPNRPSPPAWKRAVAKIVADG